MEPAEKLVQKWNGILSGNNTSVHAILELLEASKPDDVDTNVHLVFDGDEALACSFLKDYREMEIHLTPKRRKIGAQNLDSPASSSGDTPKRQPTTQKQRALCEVDEIRERIEDIDTEDEESIAALRGALRGVFARLAIKKGKRKLKYGL